jgi:5-methylcytosine-specific restriction endonuclease McrA
MPIRPENQLRYPANWREIRARILARAGNRCEFCGVPNGAVGYREEDGSFVQLAASCRESGMETEAACLDGKKIIVIVLTIAHLDHVPEHCGDENLKALCQRCHLKHDRQQHAQTAYATRRAARATGDLFP